LKDLSVTMIIENTSERVADDGSNDNSTAWFLWTISVKSIPVNFMDYIESVIYYLHPTFSQNVIKSEDRESNFLLVSRGWGEFNIRVEIILKDKRRALLNHWLSLEDENGIKKTQTTIKLKDNDFKNPKINLTK
jgi:transcription initiation factor IIF auxiliary subunit